MRIDALVLESARTLARAGIENARLEARVIARAASGASVEMMVAHPEREIDETSAAFARALVERRVAGAPMAYLVGHKEFWSLDFAVTAATLVPRADSETLVSGALAFAADAARQWRVLDLGTGSGCLLLSFLSERPAARGLAVDRSMSALGVAAANADSLGLAARTSFVCADWAQSIAGQFDIILSNPPYIPRDEIPGLAIEVRDFEPRDALDGGPDGLDCYRRIVADLPRILSDDGMCFFEVGIGQAEDVARLARAQGMSVAGTLRDLAGVERCVRVTK